MWDLATIPISPSPQTRVAPDRCGGFRPGKPDIPHLATWVALLRAAGDLPPSTGGTVQDLRRRRRQGGPRFKIVKLHLNTFAPPGIGTPSHNSEFRTGGFGDLGGAVPFKRKFGARDQIQARGGEDGLT